MTSNKLIKTTAFYALVVAIVIFSVFPFYYAIVTSFATGTRLFEINYFPPVFDWSNYESVLGGRTFPRNILNSVFIASTTVIPGFSSPRRSASSMILSARRSLTEAAGLKNSAFT